MMHPLKSRRRRLVFELLERRELLASDFTVVLMPDTQNYAESFPATFSVQTQWVLDQVQSGDVQFVSHVGDVVETASQLGEWAVADAAFDILDDGLTNPDGAVPYSVVPGNHDFSPTNSHGSLANFHDHFGEHRYERRSWYGGSSPNGANYYQVVKMGGYDILHLGLEWEPRADSVAWAQGILDAHRDLPTIVSSHAYLNQGGRYTGATTLDGLDGEQIFQTLIKPNSQVFMVVGGHFAGEDHQTSLNDAGLEVHELVADYQARPNGGDGWLQLLKFRPNLDMIEVTTYSPTLDQFETDANSQFNLNLDFDQRLSIDAAPVAQWSGPLDNSHGDFDPALYSVTVNQTQVDFRLRLHDYLTGVDDSTVVSSSVILLRDSVVQTEGVDYVFGYDAVADEIVLTPIGSVFGDGAYEIQLGGAGVIADLDGNAMSMTSRSILIDTALVTPPGSLHFAVRDPVTIGTLAVENEDVVTFDGAEYSMLFDGSDVGVASFGIDGFAMLDTGDLLLSFTAAGMVPGISTAVDDSDIVRFTPTQLGDTTSGTFSLYFDASDVELTTGDEDTDGISVLADGRVLISVRGAYTVGALSGDDEDVLAFTPTQLGDTTAGTWEIYFDGEDVGLAAEDMNAISGYLDGDLYLSSANSVDLPEMTVRNEDVFRFVPTTLGDMTAGAFPSPPLFDGSANGFENDIFGLHVPVPAPGATILTVQTGPLGAGVAAQDGATGTGYMMYSQQPLSSRFDVLAGVSEHFVPVRWVNHQWHYDNNSRLIPFAPDSTDLLVASIDFTNDTITSLQDTVDVVNGLDSGFTGGDLMFIANQFGGGPNGGEFEVVGTSLDRRLPREIASYSAGELAGGVAAKDNATGQGFLMYSQQSLHQRFGGLVGGSSDHFIAVVNSTGGWSYDLNGSLVSFDPLPSDVLVASIDFAADTIVSLEGSVSSHQGIRAGYLDGDLQFFADQFGGVFNEGEFQVTGTHFRQLASLRQYEVGPLHGGIAANDSASGMAYLMFSEESLFERFEASPPVAGSSEHLMVVTYAAGQWSFDENGSTVPFAPRESDVILAEIDYGADTITSLEGELGDRFGVMAGYTSGNLQFFADRFGNNYNEGEFQARGTYFRTLGTPQRTVIVETADLGGGLPARDGATGTGFILYSQQPLSERFVMLAGSAEHFVPVVYTDGHWHYDNNSRLVPFTPEPADLLVAEVDFGADLVTSLQDTDGVHYGIDSGFVGGDLTFAANMFGGVPNAGEFAVQGTEFRRRIDESRVAEMQLGQFGSGVPARDAATGQGYIMYTEQDAHLRFVGVPAEASDQFVVVTVDQDVWYYDNDLQLAPFTPRPTDVLVASVDFDSDTSTSFEGRLGSVAGIQSGYLDGQLKVFANKYAGASDPGEFQIFGSKFNHFPTTAQYDVTASVGPLNSGVAADVSGLGTGYLMFSMQPLSARFGGTAAGAADHIGAVIYANDQWSFDNDGVLTPFAPAATDVLLAEFLYGAGSVQSLVGLVGQLHGVQYGYRSGDLSFVADQFGGAFSPGDFEVFGTFFTR